MSQRDIDRLPCHLDTRRDLIRRRRLEPKVSASSLVRTLFSDEPSPRNRRDLKNETDRLKEAIVSLRSRDGDFLVIGNVDHIGGVAWFEQRVGVEGFEVQDSSRFLNRRCIKTFCFSIPIIEHETSEP